MGHENGARASGDGLFKPVRNSRIIAQVHIYKDRNQTVLDNGRHRGGKASRHRDDLIAGLQRPLPEFW